MNIPHRQLMGEETCQKTVLGQDTLDQLECHLEIFFSNLPQQHLESVCRENNYTLGQLAHVFKKLPSVYQSAKFEEYLHAHLDKAI